jgi:hypothetical protein
VSLRSALFAACKFDREISADWRQDAVVVRGCERCIGMEDRLEKASQHGYSASAALGAMPLSLSLKKECCRTERSLQPSLSDAWTIRRRWPATEPPSRRRTFRDAMRSFHRHIPQLGMRLGALLRIRPDENPVDQIWRGLRLLVSSRYFLFLPQYSNPRFCGPTEISSIVWLQSTRNRVLSPKSFVAIIVTNFP